MRIRVSFACLLLLSLVPGVTRADVPGVTLTISGPTTYLPGATATYSGRLLLAGTVGVPLMDVELLLDTNPVATVTTGLDGTWTADVALAYPPDSHTLQAVVLRDTLLQVASPLITTRVAQRLLTVVRSGSGSGTVTSPAGISCPSDCSENLVHGTSATLTATAGPGSMFAGWSGGGCGGTAPTCTVTMSSPRTVTATFTSVPVIEFTTTTASGGEIEAATITVIRTGDTSGTSTVFYATADGTAVAPADYTATSGTLTFPPGQAAAMFSVPVVNDTLDEDGETFHTTLSAPTNAVLGSITTLTHAIHDDDLSPAVGFAASASSGTEATSPAQITVTLTAVSGRTVTVAYSTSNSSAVAPGDYTASSGTVTFNPSETSKNIAVPVIDDSTAESDETFFIFLSSPVNASFGTITMHTRTIVDNDIPIANNETDTPQEADYAVLQFPAALSVTSGQMTPLIYGRVFEAGVVDTAAPGPQPEVGAQVGYGPAGSDPRSAGGWTWVDAFYSTQAGNNDEYAAQFVAPAAGTYAYTIRFSFDGGASYTYADLDGAGSNAGLTFSPAQLGTMSVTA
jgi:hypothetical protein